ASPRVVSGRAGRAGRAQRSPVRGERGEVDGGGRWRRRREARPGEILTAALEQFVEHGFAATKMEDIARRAGVTKGTVYLYYPSKEELFRAAVEETIVPSLSLGEQLLEEKSTSAAQLFRALIATWWDFMSAPPLSGIPKLIVAEAANFPAVASFFAEKVQLRGRRLFERVLERGVQAGEFRAELDVSMAARVALAPVVWSLVHRHSLHVCERGGVDLDAFLEVHIDIFLRGIAAEPNRIEAN
ncbi:MAG TPA: TetR/AcrR family transcriptional regulator, partial [Longimicrobiales bacterium]